MALHRLVFLLLIQQSFCVMPPKFQWKTIDFVWNSQQSRESALDSGDYVPESIVPTGLARWKDKLFVTIPRWKKGVPSSLNYIRLDGPQEQPLNPYPSWIEGFVPHDACCAPRNSTVVCAFRAHVDACDRLWVVDNGVADLTGDLKKLSDPAIVVFDLINDSMLRKYALGDKVKRDNSVFTSIVVDIIGAKHKNKAKTDCTNAYAYITDMGSNAIVIYSFKDNDAWRIQIPYANNDTTLEKYRIGGVDFRWKDGVSSATLSNPDSKGYRDLYFHPTSCTKQFKISTRLLRNKTAAESDIFNGVQIIGDRGPMSQATACDFDSQSNILFYTQLSKNGIACWNTNQPLTEENTPLILSDCNMMEFPNDIKVDHEGKIWILSNRQSRFLFGKMDFEDVNFRILTSPVSHFIKGTACEKQSKLCKAFGSKNRKSSIGDNKGPAKKVKDKK